MDCKTLAKNLILNETRKNHRRSDARLICHFAVNCCCTALKTARAVSSGVDSLEPSVDQISLSPEFGAPQHSDTRPDWQKRIESMRLLIEMLVH